MGAAILAYRWGPRDEVAGEGPCARPAQCGSVAQLGERVNRTHEVRGSNPLGSTNLKLTEFPQYEPCRGNTLLGISGFAVDLNLDDQPLSESLGLRPSSNHATCQRKLADEPIPEPIQSKLLRAFRNSRAL